MQQFFIDNIDEPKLSDEQMRQCLKVLRMRKGDQIRLVDHQKRGKVVAFNNDELTRFDEIETIVWPEKQHELILIAAMIRSERLEWMIQKACELGVDEIVLYRAKQGVVRDFGKREDRKIERFNMIAKEACEQSYRNKAVKVKGPVEIQDLKEYQKQQNFYADIGETPHLIHALNPTGSVAVIVGPEGGFHSEERVRFEKDGFVEVSLGNNVLRAETASMEVCSIVAMAEVIS